MQNWNVKFGFLANTDRGLNFSRVLFPFIIDIGQMDNHDYLKKRRNQTNNS